MPFVPQAAENHAPGIADRDAARRWLDVAENGAPEAREEAYEALESLASNFPESIPALVRGLGDDNTYWPAEAALRTYGPRALDALLRAVAGDDRKIRFLALPLIEALGRDASRAAPALLAQLEGATRGRRDVPLCEALLYALRAMGGEAVARAGALENIWEHLAEAFANKNMKSTDSVYTVDACLGILATSGEAGKRFTSGLLEMLVHEYPSPNEPLTWGRRAHYLSRTLAALWFDEATEEAPIMLRSPQQEIAPFMLRVGRPRWQEGPSTTLITPLGRWGME